MRKRVRRHALEHDRRGRLCIDMGRHRHELCGRHNREFRVRSRNHCVGDAIAFFDFSHAVADGVDDAGTLHAERERPA